MKKYRVGIIGATGMVGQRFALLLENHPWFTVAALAASSRSAGKTYKEAVGGRWLLSDPMPQSMENMIVMDAEKDVAKVTALVDLVFCAVNLDKQKAKELEETYAKAECPVISNNSANRSVPDVPMIIPEINADHAAVISTQRKRLGTSRGFIAVKPNCSLQTYVPAVTPLLDRNVTKILACTYQAISGAGKNFRTWPEMNDNVIPFIGGEEGKSENEPMKIWGRVENGIIVNAEFPNVTTQCLRVPVSDGHIAAVFLSFEKKLAPEEIISRWESFSGEPQKLKLPSAPKQFLHYFREEDRPQIALDRNLENGMAVSIGRLRPDSQYDMKFVCMSHNTLRGAAGGGVLMAELLCAKGYFD